MPCSEEESTTWSAWMTQRETGEPPVTPATGEEDPNPRLNQEEPEPEWRSGSHWLPIYYGQGKKGKKEAAAAAKAKAAAKEKDAAAKAKAKKEADAKKKAKAKEAAKKKKDSGCWNCGGDDHQKQDCPDPKKASGTGGGVDSLLPTDRKSTRPNSSHC